MKRADKFFTLLKLPLDLILLIAAGFSAYALRFTELATELKPILFDLPLSEYTPLLLVSVTGIMALFFVTGMYSLQRSGGIVSDIVKSAVTLSTAFLLITFYIFITRSAFESRFILLTAWGFGVAYLTFGRVLLEATKHVLLNTSKIKLNQAIVVGRTKTAKILIKTLQGNRSWGYDVALTTEKVSLDGIKKTIGHKKITDLILTDQLSPERTIEIANFCSQNAIAFHFVPTSFATFASGLKFETLSGIPLLEVQRTRIEGWGSIIKRSLDILGSAIGMIVLSPVMLVIAIAIKLDSPGPIIARIPHRVGQGGKTFFMFKFRSMVKNAEQMKKSLMDQNDRENGSGPLFKIKNDPRVTRVGKFTRRFRLDELPQLMNVLMGNMTLVGPRAHQADEINKYEDHQKVVLAVKPGITGMAQISGSSDLPFEQENKLDVYYLENWSLWLDIKILLKTALFLFFDRSAV